MAQIQSGASTDILTIDPTSKAGRFTLYDTDGSLVVRKERDFPGTIRGLHVMGAGDGNSFPVRVDQMGNIGTSSVIPVIWDQWEGTVLNTQRWANSVTTFVTAQTVTGLNLNSTNLTTASAVNVNLSRKQVLRTARGPLYYKARVRATNYPNSVSDWGVADTVSGLTTIANGAYFQITSAGVLQAVISTLGTPVALDVTWTGGAFDINKFYTYTIMIDDDSATFYVQDTSTGSLVGNRTMTLPATASRLFAVTHLRAFNRCYNTGTAPATAPAHICAFVFVGVVDTLLNKPITDVMAGNHLHTGISPTALTQLAQYANSAEPTSATLSNTAAGYTTLGGKFQFAAVAGAATDYALFGFTVPAPFTMFVKGITIDVWNTGAASATTPTLLTWSTMSNSTAVSLATAVPAHRQHVGAQSIPVGAAIGANVAQIQKQYQVPLVTEGGNFFVIALRMPVGTATASQVIAGAIQVDGYFE